MRMVDENGCCDRVIITSHDPKNRFRLFGDSDWVVIVFSDEYVGI